jgi:hypothetical protein
VHFNSRIPNSRKVWSFIAYICHLSLAATSSPRVMPSTVSLAPESLHLARTLQNPRMLPRAFALLFSLCHPFVWPLLTPYLHPTCLATPARSPSVHLLIIKTSSHPERLHVLKEQNPPRLFPIPMKQLLQQLMVVGHHFHHKWKTKE